MKSSTIIVLVMLMMTAGVLVGFGANYMLVGQVINQRPSIDQGPAELEVIIIDEHDSIQNQSISDEARELKEDLTQKMGIVAKIGRVRVVAGQTKKIEIRG